MTRHLTRTIPLCGTLLWATLLAASTISFASHANRAQAVADYDQAVRLRTTLESQPQDARTKTDYDKVIAAFRSVYRSDPAFTKAPMALEAVAELYQDMGRRYSDKRSFHTSIAAYEFLIKQYPRSAFSREAMLAMGEIYRTDLGDPLQAEKTLRKFLELYPKSAKAPEARAVLKEIQMLRASGAPVEDANLQSTIIAESKEENRRPGHTLEVTSIRRWVGPNYSRIVIGVEGEVGFDASRLASPDRLVFDLSNARPSPELMGKTFPVEDGFLRQIRVALFKPTVTRIVLDVERIEDYSVFPLPNPFRLVIDIHGPPRELTAKDQSLKSGHSETATAKDAELARATGKSTRAGDSSGGSGAVPEATGTGAATHETSGPQPAVIAEATTTSNAHSKGSKATSKERAAISAETNPPIKTPPPTESGSRTLTRALGLKIGRIVIDPGHGGHDTGTVGPTGFTEKDLVLDVGLRLSNLLEQEAGSEVVMTRHDDTFVPLEERTAIANEKAADLFISIHANASRDPEARGIETYYLNFTSNPDALEVAARENATSQESVHELRDLIKKIALTEKIEESREFATEVQRQVHSRVAKAGGKQKDRGVKKAPFVVLIGANMPSVLAEISFLTNPKDERMLKQPDYRQKIAQALYEGVIRYVNNLGGVRVAQENHTATRASAADAQVKTTARELSPLNPPNF